MAQVKKDQVIEILKQCYDPELPVDLWNLGLIYDCLLYTSPSPRDYAASRMPSSA